MASPTISLAGNAMKSPDLTLSLEVPLGPSALCNSCLSISVGPVSIPLRTSIPQQGISSPSRDDLAGIGNSPWLPTIGAPVP